jgi:DNA-binding winged helix-turn-helix (wHTH) protein
METPANKSTRVHGQGPQVARAASIAFGPFRLDLRAGLLMRGSVPVALRPKTWGVLHYLAERPGELVSKHEILDAIWPKVAVTEEVVGKSINELRAALGDGSGTPHFIETVPRRGFRFIGQVSGVRDQVSEVTGQSLTPDTRHPAPAPFVGRARELQRLTAGLSKTRRGERQCVFITGEAGIGKTALVASFLSSLAVREAGAPVWIARGVCIEQHGWREAYMPVLAALDRLARRPDAGRLLELLRRVAPTWLAQMPWFIGDEDEQALRRSLQQVKPERMLREFAALIEALTAEVTLVLVLEDLHWSDASTVDLLWLLGQRREPARLLLIGTFRPADAIVREHGLMNVVRTLAVRRQCVDLALSELRTEDVWHYLGERFPGNDFPPALAGVIHRHTDGNPLFMIGVVDRLLSRGDILETAPGWLLRPPFGTITLGVPDEVRLLIATGLDGLSPADRSLLQAASVAGEQCTAITVAAALGPAVGGDSAGPLPSFDRAQDGVGSLYGSKSDRLLGGDVAAVETRCEALVQASQFLRIAGEIEWPDGRVAPRYAFVHELYRQAVYEQMPAGQRMRLHARIGRALEAVYGARRVELAPQLANHFERCRDRARALRYLTIAAERARRRFANREAAGYLEAALALLTRLPEDDARRRKELQLRIALGAIFIDLHGFASERVRETFERGAELCAAVGSAAHSFGVLYARWYLHAIRGERPVTNEVAAELEEVSRRLGTAQHRVVAASVLLRTALYDGRFAEVTRIKERQLAHVPKGITAPAFGPDPLLAATTHSAIALWFLGHPERARATVHAAVARARKRGHLLTLCAILTQAAFVELLCRNVGTGSELAGESVSLSAEHGFSFWNAMASALSGWALVQQGHALEGNAAIAAALLGLQETGARFFLDFAYAFLAEGYLRAGAFADGLKAVDAGLAVTEADVARACAPELWRLKGELLLKQVESRQSKGERSRPDAGPRTVNSRRSTLNFKDAEACFLRAIELARASEAKGLELRAATSLARLWRTPGRSVEARKLLGGVCRWFGAHATSPDLVEARALLGQLQV